ncbi:hypothetical protein PF010_g13586 [Phytophthora fragariae]|nr:hypothetical protein PF011_g12944 [Phytophthora fragariae]KAE9103852.1 hypothetical protein PF010_g13586 [Phytophthora fragariae]
MDKSSFERVVNKIKDNPVFYNDSPCPQAPVWMQLAVALDRFGNYGSGASLSRSQELWGIGKGTVDDYTDRVVNALLPLRASPAAGLKDGFILKVARLELVWVLMLAPVGRNEGFNFSRLYLLATWS